MLGTTATLGATAAAGCTGVLDHSCDGDGAVGSVEAAIDEPWEVEAIAASGTDGGEVRITACAHFESTEAAEATVDAVRNRAGGTDGELDGGVAVEESVVVLEGTTSGHEL